MRNLERAAVPRSTAMKIVGHQTESIYRRYAIVDEAMMREGAEKLATLHEAQRTGAAEANDYRSRRDRAAHVGEAARLLSLRRTGPATGP